MLTASVRTIGCVKGESVGRSIRYILVFSFLGMIIGCGGGSTQSESTTTTPQASVVLNPPASNVRPGDPALQFTATVTGASDTALSWSVNGTAGGSAAMGLISTTGQYTAPATVPHQQRGDRAGLAGKHSDRARQQRSDPAESDSRGYVGEPANHRRGCVYDSGERQRLSEGRAGDVRHDRTDHDICFLDGT